MTVHVLILFHVRHVVIRPYVNRCSASEQVIGKHDICIANKLSQDLVDTYVLSTWRTWA